MTLAATNRILKYPDTQAVGLILFQGTNGYPYLGSSTDFLLIELPGDPELVGKEITILDGISLYLIRDPQTGTTSLWNHMNGNSRISTLDRLPSPSLILDPARIRIISTITGLFARAMFIWDEQGSLWMTRFDTDAHDIPLVWIKVNLPPILDVSGTTMTPEYLAERYEGRFAIELGRARLVILVLLTDGATKMFIVNDDGSVVPINLEEYETIPGRQSLRSGIYEIKSID